jgi:hypothetical protein
MGDLFSKPAQENKTKNDSTVPENTVEAKQGKSETKPESTPGPPLSEEKQKRFDDLQAKRAANSNTPEKIAEREAVKAKEDAEAKAKTDAEEKAKTEEDEINKILTDPTYRIKSNKIQDEASNEVGENIIKLVGSLETKNFDTKFKELYRVCKEWAGNKILNHSSSNGESGITGFTPLFIVVQKLPKSFIIPDQKTGYDNGLKIIKLLIAAGADVNAIATDKDSSKYSVIDKVSKFNPEAKKLIEDAGGKSSRGMFGNALWGGKKRSIKKAKKRTAKATQKRKYKNKRKSTNRH